MTRALILLAPLAAALAAASPAAPLAASPDREAARFGPCGTGPRTDCVVDGDTFWYAAHKVRVADINTPETHHAQCASEAALGEAATARLTALLNAGPFTLAPWTDGRDRDRYGRLLRVVTRRGASLGQVLVSEGLAEPWRGRRSGWCGARA